MNSTLQSNDVRHWLLERLLHPAVIEIWIYGSFLTFPATAADVDVMIQYADHRMNEVLALRKSVEHDFRCKFGLPLHLILLSSKEVAEEITLVRALLGSGQRLR